LPFRRERKLHENGPETSGSLSTEPRGLSTPSLMYLELPSVTER